MKGNKDMYEEKDYAQALGVELPEEKQNGGAGGAEDTGTTADAGNTNDGAASVNTDGNTDTSGSTDGVNSNPGNDSGTDPETDPNASAAARRRAMESRIEREREKAKREARTEIISELRRASAAAASASANNPPAVDTVPRDSGGRFARRMQAQPREQDYSDLDRRISAAVENHPAVLEARAAMQKMHEQELRDSFTEDMAKITAMMPELKSEEDILALPEHDLILELVNKGYKPSDAVYSVFSDRITAAATERGKRQAQAQAASKSHLIPDSHRGSGVDTGVVVPADVQQMYRDMIPGISDADIAKHYGKYKKQNE